MMTYRPTRLVLQYSFVAIVCLAFVGGATRQGWAAPNTTTTKKYCGCTCGNSGGGTKFLYWEKRYSCSLADGKACKMDIGNVKDVPGTLHSCQDCTRNDKGEFLCRNQGMAPLSGGGARVPPTGKLEQIVPRGIEGAQETAPPVTGSEEKGTK
jgi:hypothetical protein